MTFPWWLPATLAAIAWGLQYAFSEPLLQKLPVLSYLVITHFVSFLIFLAIWLYPGNDEKKEVMQVLADTKTVGLLCATIFFGLLGNFLICVSVRDAGASYSSIIEISYPLFVLLFSWMIFRIPVDNLGWFLGGSAMVIGGISMIILKAKA